MTLSETPTPAICRETICTVVITYHPDADFPKRLQRMAAQAARVIIVDNASGAEAQEMLRACQNSGESHGAEVELVLNPTNIGIAAALNQGARTARAAGFGWLLMFDQDTQPSEGLAAGLAVAGATCAAAGGPDGWESLAIVAANYSEVADPRPGYRGAAAGAAEWRNEPYVITSGSLLSLAAYEAVGPFREDFFIDYVDVEYCFRACALGYQVVATRALLMTQVIGAPQPHRFLGRVWYASNYPAWRWRHRAANLVITARLYRRQEPNWVREAWWNLTVTTAKILLFEPQKAAKIQSIALGILRGVGYSARKAGS